MSFLPKGLTRLSGSTLLKLRAGSPTILVVTGVGGFVVTTVLAAKASRKMDPILEAHKKARVEIGYIENEREQQRQIGALYGQTSYELLKLFGPTILMGVGSTVAIFGGHKILKTRYVATMAAYSGLLEQFRGYRDRVVKTLGKEMEQSIFDGGHGEYVEDPEHPGEYKLESKYDDNEVPSYLRPWFDESNVNWTRDPQSNYLFLKGIQSHMNNLLEIRGHVFLNDVFDALRMDRVPEGAVSGWRYNSKKGDNFVDFGFMTGTDPSTIAFRNGQEKSVRLNFNVDGIIWDKI